MDIKFNQVGLENCSISEITLAELIYGAECISNPAKNLAIIETFIDQVTILPIINAIFKYGEGKARLRKAGLLISDFDLLIGCTAVTNNQTMVTENSKYFKRITDIKLESWIDRKV